MRSPCHLATLPGFMVVCGEEINLGSFPSASIIFRVTPKRGDLLLYWTITLRELSDRIETFCFPLCLSRLGDLEEAILESISNVLGCGECLQHVGIDLPSQKITDFLRSKQLIHAGGKENHQKAISILKSFHDQHPSFEECNSLLADAMLRSYGSGWGINQSDLSIARNLLKDDSSLSDALGLETLVRLGVHLDKSADSLEGLLVYLSRSKSQRVDTSISLAFGYLHAGLTEDAYEVIMRFYDRHPPARLIARSLWIPFYNKDYTTVVKMAALCTEHISSDPDLPWCVGLSLAGLQRHHCAVSILKDAVTQFPAHFRSHLYLGHILADSGFANDARAAWNDGISSATLALREDPNNKHVLMWRARLYSRTNDVTNCIRDLSMAQSLDRPNGYMAFLQALPLMYLNREKEAIRFLSRSIVSGFRFLGPTWELRKSEALSDACDIAQCAVQETRVRFERSGLLSAANI